MELGELPAGWASTSIGEVCSNLQYGYTASSSKEPNGPRFLRITDIQDGLVAWSSVPFCQIDSLQLDKYLLRSGDLVFARTGGTVGKSFLIGHLPEPAVFASYLIRLSPSKEVDPKYLYYFFQSTEYWEQIGLKKGGLQGNVNAKTLSSVEFRFSPFTEQHRIVAKIEELFSELDQGVASLKTAREQLKVYRQSLLKNAFEGKLTAAWRAAHGDQLETATSLQQRIGRERQVRYQQQLTDWQTGGQLGTKPKSPKLLPPLTADELAELPKLPVGWEWARVGQIADVQLGRQRSPNNRSNRFPVKYIRAGNLTDDGLNLSDVLDMEFEPEERERFLLKFGDVLLSEASGSAHQVGKPAVWRGEIEECCFQNTVLRVRSLSELSEYIFWVFKACYVTGAFAKLSGGVGINHLSAGKLNGMAIPLVGEEESKVVIQLINEKLSQIENLDQTLATALQQADALRQSILKKAFCGQLVAQDKNDEPATVLLERIRAAKLGQGQGKRRRIAPEQLEILELTASPGQVIPFPVPLPGIAAKDLQAGILAMAYRLHEPHPEKLQHFGHVKAEKICHLVEAHLGLDLERQPCKEAAGPNDHPHLKRVEHRARLANWFEVTRLDSGKYVFHPKPGFSRLLDKTRQVLGARLGEVERLLELMLPMTMRQAEILATVYAAWNNLLLLGKSPNDEEIVTEARENWHESKLKIERDKFFTALAWMRGKGLVPSGRGRFVKAKGEV